MSNASSPRESASRRPASRHRVRGVPALAVLVAATLVVGALVFQAFRAEQDQHATADRALRDYAGFAAWEFASNAKEQMWQAMTELLRPVEQLGPVPHGASLPPTSVLLASEKRVRECDCAVPLPAAYYFRLDLRNGAFETEGSEKPASAERGWLVDTVWKHARRAFDPRWRVATIVGSPDGVRRTVAYTIVRDSTGGCVAAYGVVSESGKFMAAISRELYTWSLLPPALAKQAGSDRLVSVMVHDDQDHVIYRSPWQFAPTYSASYDLEKFVSGFTVRASLDPELAGTLIFTGGSYRLPVLLALLALTMALVAIAVRQLRREAALARLRSDFVSSVSHELRTPLAQIRMFAELLRMGWVRSDEERTRSLEIIDQESRRLANLVDKVLRFEATARGDAARPLNTQRTELATLVGEVVEAFAPLARSSRVNVQLALDPTVTAEVDRGAIRQVLINLLDNAVKYGPAEQTVTVGVAPRGAMARLWVADEGPGIPEGDRERIWEPFRRLSRDSNSAVAGSGIGLSLVKELVLAHGGRVAAEDVEKEHGARFIVDLPRVIAPAPDDHPFLRERDLAATP